MRNAVVAIFALVCVWAAPARAADPPIVTTNPAEYAQTYADSVALGGVEPIRDIFQTMQGGTALATDLEAAIMVYERANLTKPAAISRVIEDVQLSDVLRVIYTYHYFGANSWIFSRLEFVRVSDTEWALNRVAFADRWANVVLETTPSFRATTPSRR